MHGSAGTSCTYAIAGLGMVQAKFKGNALMQDADSFERTQTDLALAAGVPVWPMRREVAADDWRRVGSRSR